MGEWRESAKGNWWTTTTIAGEKKYVTVFKLKNGGNAGMWKFVCNDEFSEEAYRTADDAMAEASGVYL